jgi:two-component system cell cycle sensor histidine kinase/response regulator CckA
MRILMATIAAGSVPRFSNPQGKTMPDSVENKLRQARKMEAVGRLTGALAHDFNNLLSVIACYSSMVEAGLPPQGPLGGYIQEIHQASNKAADLTRQLLVFSAEKPAKTALIQLDDLLAGMAALFPLLAGKYIEVKTAGSAGLAAINADAGLLEQLVGELLLDARESMPSGGTVTVETCNVALDEKHAMILGKASSGPHVMLSVCCTETGAVAPVEGVPLEFMLSAAETRDEGLTASPNVAAIVRENGGGIWVRKGAGRGKTSRIYFPAAPASMEHVPL